MHETLIVGTSKQVAVSVLCLLAFTLYVYHGARAATDPGQMQEGCVRIDCPLDWASPRPKVPSESGGTTFQPQNLGPDDFGLEQ